MQIVDNWANVTGTVVETRPGVEGTIVMLSVSSAEDFEDYPNLLTWAKGQLLTVLYPSEASLPEIGQPVLWRLQIFTPGIARPHASSIP